VKNWTGKLAPLIGRLLHDEHGGEVIEWALIAGLIIVASIATVAAFGTKVLSKWTSLNNSV
jgi:Flp pilus assembly pilin Flp